jgi:hypothetical protein
VTALFKSNSARAGHLSPGEAKSVVSVPMPDGPTSSLATLYAQLAPTVRAPTQVAVQLEAELMGIRTVLATVAMPPGYSGIVAVATGIVADVWHGSAYGVLERGSLRMSLGVRPCCSGFGITVPAELQTRLTPRLKSGLPAPCMPLVRHEGAYDVETDVAPGVVTVAATQRVLRVEVITNGAASVSGLGLSPLTIGANQQVSWEPRGNVEGPRTLNFAGGIAYYSVEMVH